MQSEQEINRVIAQYGDMVRRICFLYLKNRDDTEDIFQNVFLKYLLRDDPFDSPEHEKAWFARIAINACRDLLRSFARRANVPLEEAAAVSELPKDPDQQDLLRAV